MSSKNLLKNPRNDLHSKILVTMTSRDVYYVLINRTLCAGKLFVNARTKEYKISITNTTCLTSPFHFLLSLLGILPFFIISKVFRSMTKPQLLKNLILTWGEVVSHIKKNDVIKFGNTLNKLFVNII